MADTRIVNRFSRIKFIMAERAGSVSVFTLVLFFLEELIMVGESLPQYYGRRRTVEKPCLPHLPMASTNQPVVCGNWERDGKPLPPDITSSRRRQRMRSLSLSLPLGHTYTHSVVNNSVHTPAWPRSARYPVGKHMVLLQGRTPEATHYGLICPPVKPSRRLALTPVY